MEKPGYKTTEFWLTTLAMVIGTLIASGVFADATALGKVLAFAASALAALGYTSARTSAKNVAAKAAALALPAATPEEEATP